MTSTVGISPTVIVEVNFTGPNTGTYLHVGDSARGIIGTNTVGPEELWTDVSEYVYWINIERGSRRVDGPVIRYEAGTCSIVLDNSDRRFDPTNLAGPYVSGGVTEVVPMRGVRVRATYGAVTYQLFRGFADSWPISYQQPAYCEVTLNATDGSKVLGNNSRAVASAVGTGEDSGARISRILNSAGWPTADRVIATGDTTLQSTTLEGDALVEAQLVSDTEIGEFYFDGAGRAFFRNRHGTVTDTRSSVSQATFGDSTGELEYDDLAVDYDDATLHNLVRIARVGGATQTAEDTNSQTSYLIHTFERSDLLMQTDTDAAQYASHVLAKSKDPELRFVELHLDPQGDDTFEATLYPHVLGREIGDRITVIRRPPGGGSAIQRDVFIRGIKHAVDFRQGTWKSSWPLQAAANEPFLVIGSAAQGLIGTNAVSW